MTGAVLNTLNTRLDAETDRLHAQHGEAKVLITDREYSATVKKALELAHPQLLVIDVDDPEYRRRRRAPRQHRLRGLPGRRRSELSPGSRPTTSGTRFSLNYTSGTTGNPKGVVYHHRGAYLNALSNIVSWGMPPHSVYLWTLPMFHCNGWCFPWTMAANAGTNVCLRRVDARLILDAIREHG